MAGTMPVSYVEILWPDGSTSLEVPDRRTLESVKATKTEATGKWVLPCFARLLQAEEDIAHAELIIQRT